MENKGSYYGEAMYERDTEFDLLVITRLQGLTFGKWGWKKLSELIAHTKIMFNWILIVLYRGL